MWNVTKAWKLYWRNKTLSGDIQKGLGLPDTVFPVFWATPELGDWGFYDAETLRWRYQGSLTLNHHPSDTVKEEVDAKVWSRGFDVDVELLPGREVIHLKSEGPAEYVGFWHGHRHKLVNFKILKEVIVSQFALWKGRDVVVGLYEMPTVFIETDAEGATCDVILNSEGYRTGVESSSPNGALHMFVDRGIFVEFLRVPFSREAFLQKLSVLENVKELVDVDV
jgi:hypothetical protein